MSISEEQFKTYAEKYKQKTNEFHAAWAMLEVICRLGIIDRKSYRDIVNILDSYFEAQERLWLEIKDEYYGNML